MPRKVPSRQKKRPRAARKRRAAGRRAGADGSNPSVAASAISEIPDDQEKPAGGSAAGPDFTIVGVGASAGGLEAFSQLLRALAPDSGLAIVLIQHLAPKHESLLATLLSDFTTMPVKQVSEETRLKPNHVYVIPPNYDMTVIGGALRLEARHETRLQHMPIDFFFRSLAEYAKGRAVGVVLSGTASDGSAGLREIKAAGGIAFAQSIQSAKYDGMPRAAIATGIVDMVLPPEEIARELLQIAHHPLLRRHQPADADGARLMEEHLQRIFFLLRSASGVDFTHYKLPTIRRRLQRRMVLNKIEDVEQYIKFLQQHPDEVKSLYQDILIHVTRFFREPESFDFLKSRIFGQIIKRRSGDQPIRIWVPGCSTGEEAYSVAIVLLEFLGDDANRTPIQIFATDVSNLSVEQARAGIFSENISSDVAPDRLRRFFTRVDASYRISKPVRDMVVFARQDLTRDPPFSKLDLIVCRNVLIYLGPVLQKRLMYVFHYALKPSGYLMLGGSETVGPYSDLFAMADKRHKIYTKKLTGLRNGMDLPAVEYKQARDGLDNDKKPVADARPSSGVQTEANRIILSKYAPPGVIVDEDLQIIQFRGQTGLFLEPAPGEASLHLLKMAREGLLYDLRTAVHEARKTGATVRRTGLHVKYKGRIHDVNIEVIPLAVSGSDHHMLVIFQDVTAPHQEDPPPRSARRARGKKGAKHLPPGAPSSERMNRLQKELAASREYLQSIIQDHEAANEELQSANEEILSSNEELQSTNEELDTAKEELQSTNEELNTVNEELQGRNEELSQVNSDLINLLGSVQIAIVMVASDLRIRRFTPMAEKVLNLIPSDIGRPIGDIKPNIDCADLGKLITEAIDNMRTLERQVEDRNGNSYLMRIRPYKNIENRIDGAVVALFESGMQGGLRAEIEAILAVMRQPALLLDRELCVQMMNPAFGEFFKIPLQKVIGQTIDQIKGADWDLARLRDSLENHLESNAGAGIQRLKLESGSSAWPAMNVDVGRVRWSDGSADRIVLIFEAAQA